MTETTIIRTILPDAFGFQWRCAQETGCTYSKPILCISETEATNGATSHVKVTGHTAVVESRATEEVVASGPRG